MFYTDWFITLHKYTVQLLLLYLLPRAAVSVPSGGVEHLAYGELEAVDAATSGATQDVHKGHAGAAMQVNYLKDLLHCEEKLRLRHQVRLGQNDLLCSAVQYSVTYQQWNTFS